MVITVEWCSNRPRIAVATTGSPKTLRAAVRTRTAFRQRGGKPGNRGHLAQDRRHCRVAGLPRTLPSGESDRIAADPGKHGGYPCIRRIRMPDIQNRCCVGARKLVNSPAIERPRPSPFSITLGERVSSYEQPAAINDRFRLGEQQLCRRELTVTVKLSMSYRSLT